MVLLGFCLISFTLSSVIVGFAIAKDGAQTSGHKVKVESQTVVQSSKKSEKTVSSIEKKNKAPLPHKNMIDLLSQQLTELGYVAQEQQLGFVNWALNSKRQSLNDINPQEFNYLLGIIQRYTPQKVASA